MIARNMNTKVDITIVAREGIFMAKPVFPIFGRKPAFLAQQFGRRALGRAKAASWQESCSKWRGTDPLAGCGSGELARRERVSEDETAGRTCGLMGRKSGHLRPACGKIQKLMQLFYVSVVKQCNV